VVAGQLGFIPFERQIQFDECLATLDLESVRPDRHKCYQVLDESTEFESKRVVPETLMKAIFDKQTEEEDN